MVVVGVCDGPLYLGCLAGGRACRRRPALAQMPQAENPRIRSDVLGAFLGHFRHLRRKIFKLTSPAGVTPIINQTTNRCCGDLLRDITA